MSIPASIEKLLHQDKIAFREVDESVDARDAGSVAKVLFFHCRDHELQVLIPADCLLDLVALNEASGNECQAFSAEATREIFAQHGIETIPAIPALTSFRTLVDENLLRMPVVHLQSGVPGKLLGLEKTEFRRLLGDTASAVVTVPLSKLVREGGNSSEDLDQIKAALHSRTRLKIQERLEQTLEIPPLPSSAQKIMDLRAQEDPDVDDLVRIVESDAPLAAKVVSYASSPFFGVGSGLKSVQEAIVRVLGFERVMNLALGLAMGQTLKLPSDAPQDELPFWEQSVICAALVDKLGRGLPADQRPEPGLAYLAGLLHNFGNLIVAHVFPEQFSLACRYIEASPHISHAAIERHLISVTREQLASSLMRSWKMPDSVCIALRYQEDADYEETHYQYANLLFVANRLIAQWHTGDMESHSVPASVYERLDLSREDAREIADKVFENVGELQATAQQLAK